MSEKPQRQDEPKDVLNDEFISIETTGGIVVVERSQVRWIEAKGDYTWLHTDKHNHLCRQPLASLEECWGGHGFVRIHKSYLVAFSLVTKLSKSHLGWFVTLGSGPTSVDLPISRRKVQAVKQRWAQKLSP